MLGVHQQALTISMSVIGSRAGAAGMEPAPSERETARPTGRLAHDVSILPGIGRHFGSQPRANTSITKSFASCVIFFLLETYGYASSNQRN